MEQKAFASILLSFLVISMFMVRVSAQEDQDFSVYGFELEKLLAMLNGLISIFLFTLAFIAYRRDGRKRLLYVSLAFLLFAIKSFLVASELFVPDIDWFDPASVVLEFCVLLSFFYGVLKK